MLGSVQKIESYQWKLFPSLKNVVLFYSSLSIFFPVWWRQASLWCYCETTDVTMAKTKMFISASNLWWNLQYQNGKEVNLSSYRYITRLVVSWIWNSFNQLLLICPPLSLKKKKKKSIWEVHIYFFEYYFCKHETKLKVNII